MTVTLSVAIMAHPMRQMFIPDLLAALGDPDIPVVWDRWADRWDTGRRAMLAYDPACTHHVVIQDDVVPCRDLLEGLVKALERIPSNAPLCGYVGRYKPPPPFLLDAIETASREAASYLTMHTLNWGPLIAVPTDAIPAMIAHGDELPTISNYDRRLSRYWELDRGVRVWYTWPSLVDHRESPSVVPGRPMARPGHPGGRVADHFLGRDRSALKVNWDGPVVNAAGGLLPEITIDRRREQ
jgi:hypothetical protein